ncbi:MAG: T9SS type A sorting domain-containing protein [Bacteroidales bacterium]|nr:T9SS type A sorting domain-containing protein [Bacteroidales bacterium]
MKRIALLVTCLLASVLVFGQSITLTFTGQSDENQWVKLNKVVIENLSREWQEIITYPDTTFGMTEVGVRDFGKKGENLLFQNVPNPFNGETDVTINLTQNEKVAVDVYDIHGKAVLSHKQQLPAGKHTFRLHLNVPQTYLMMVRTKWQKAAIKMVNLKSGGSNSIDYVGANGSIAYTLKASKGDTPFVRGDSMSYTGYATVDNMELVSDNIRQVQTESEDITLMFHTKTVIVTGNITDITYTSASCEGELVTTSGFPITEKGICYAGTAEPTIENTKLTAGNELGAFKVDLTNLEPGRTYYVKAFVTTSRGTFYGEQKSFTTIAYGMPVVNTTAVTDITLTSAVSGGEIAENGGAPVYDCGLCWGTSEHPDKNSNTAMGDLADGKFTIKMENLQPETTYYVRAYATNSAGTSFGNEFSFQTLSPVMPTVVTGEVSSISLNSAFCSGAITDDGGTAITEAGICWATKPTPTKDSSHVTAAAGVNEFTLQMTGLSASTHYYVRAYAMNAKGLVYGEQREFNTPALPFASVVTTPATNITRRTAVTGGNVIDDAGLEVTARGICYGTEENPNLYNGIQKHNGSGVGSYLDTITNLTPNTTYYVRAFATNATGTSYGQQISFTTDTITPPRVMLNTIYSITRFSAYFNYSVVCDNEVYSLDRGICLDTLPDPTVESPIVTHEGYGTGISNVQITDLESGVTYYVRAYATNEAGTVYSEAKNFTTISCVPPTVTTKEPYNITTKGAYSGGTLVSDGGARVRNVGVVFAKHDNPVKDDGTSTTITHSDVETWNSNLAFSKWLEPSTTYYVRAWAENECGVGYGEIYSFTTLDVELPTVTTDSVGSIEALQATCYYSVVTDGGGTLSKRGVCWDYEPDVNLEKETVKKIENYGYIGSYSVVITGLEAGATVYVRAYASNENGVAYGNELSFTTLGLDLAEISTVKPASISPFSAIIGGVISYDGGTTVTERGICVATHTTPTISDTKVTRGTGTGWFVATAENLTPNTTYYARAFATNGDGTAYGEEYSFTTRNNPATFTCGQSAVEDYDGNKYPTVALGSQCWMGTNLRVTHYADGTEISKKVNTGSTYTDRIAYTDPDYLNQNSIEYGYGYSFACIINGTITGNEQTVGSSANPSGIQGPCPTGWHVPSLDEFNQMYDYIRNNGLCHPETPSSVTKALSSAVGWTDKYSPKQGAPSYEPEKNNTSEMNVYPASYRSGASSTFDREAVAVLATTNPVPNGSRNPYAYYGAYIYTNYTDPSTFNQNWYRQSTIRCVKD